MINTTLVRKLNVVSSNVRETGVQEVGSEKSGEVQDSGSKA